MVRHCASHIEASPKPAVIISAFRVKVKNHCLVAHAASMGGESGEGDGDVSPSRQISKKRPQKFEYFSVFLS